MTAQVEFERMIECYRGLYISEREAREQLQAKYEKLVQYMRHTNAAIPWEV